jgi:hypothetical protein
MKFDYYIKLFKVYSMELLLILKFMFFIGVIATIYAVARNLDIIKIILIYWKDLILRK